MKYRIWTIPASFSSETLQREFDKFISSHIIIDMEKKFFQTESGAYWTFCVGYNDMGSHSIGSHSMGSVKAKQNSSQNTAEKPDYRKILGDKYPIFEKYKAVRTEMAKEAGLPPYTVFTDFELAEIVKTDSPSEATITANNNIGKNKAGKYGKELLERYNKISETQAPKEEAKDEKSGIFD